MTDEQFQNEFADIVAEVIVRGALKRGSYTDIVSVAERVLAGVVDRCIAEGGDEQALDLIYQGAQRRLKKNRSAIRCFTCPPNRDVDVGAYDEMPG